MLMDLLREVESIIKELNDDDDFYYWIEIVVQIKRVYISLVILKEFNDSVLKIKIKNKSPPHIKRIHP